MMLNNRPLFHLLIVLLAVLVFSPAGLRAEAIAQERESGIEVFENAIESLEGAPAAAESEEQMESAAHEADHAVTEHGGGHEESSAGLPQLDVSTFPSQLFWLVVTFCILYLVFSKKSLPEISGVLENRQQHIQSDLETAERLKHDAEKAQHAYEASLDGAKREATATLHGIQDQMKAKAEKQNEAFRQKADKEIRELEQRLQTVKDEAMDDMNTIAAEVASEAAKKIVGIDPDLEHAKTVVKALNNTNAKAA